MNLSVIYSLTHRIYPLCLTVQLKVDGERQRGLVNICEHLIKRIEEEKVSWAVFLALRLSFLTMIPPARVPPPPASTLTAPTLIAACSIPVFIEQK